MPLTAQEYTDFMKTVYQIRDLYSEMEKEVKSFGEKTGESEQKRLSMEVTLQRLEAEMQKPAAVTPTNYSNNVNMKSKDPRFSDERLEVIKEQADVKAFGKYLRNGFSRLSQDERKMMRLASAIDAPPNSDFEQKALVTTGITVSEDTTGGMFAPPEFIAEIIKNLVLYSVLRPYCKVRPTSNRSVQMPKRTSTLTTAQWVGERAVRTDVTGWNLGRLEIPTNEMYSLVLISEQDLEDPAFDVEAAIRDEISEQFGVAEGRAFLSGDASIQPQGILTHPLIPVKKSGTNSVPTADTLLNCIYDLPSVYAGQSQFYMARQTVGVIRQLKYTGGEQSYVWQPGQGPSGGFGSAGGLSPAPNTIAGYPYIETPDMPLPAAASNSILFGDLSRAYMIVQRLGMTFKRLSERWVENSQVGIYARQRVGGQVILPEALRIYQFGP